MTFCLWRCLTCFVFFSLSMQIKSTQSKTMLHINVTKLLCCHQQVIYFVEFIYSQIFFLSFSRFLLSSFCHFLLCGGQMKPSTFFCVLSMCVNSTHTRASVQKSVISIAKRCSYSHPTQRSHPYPSTYSSEAFMPDIL